MHTEHKLKRMLDIVHTSDPQNSGLEYQGSAFLIGYPGDSYTASPAFGDAFSDPVLLLYR